MALAVTHVLVAIVILDILRHYVFGKKAFPRYLLVVGGIAGLLPDIDVPLGWLLTFLTGQETLFHRLYTHNFLFVFAFLAIGIILHYQKNMRWAKIFYVISFGFFLHLVLDCAFGGGAFPFFWPLSYEWGFCPNWNISSYSPGIDAILLVTWLVHEEIHNKIRDYI